MAWTTQKLLMFVAFACALVALIIVALAPEDMDIYFGAMAASLMFAWASFVAP